MANTKTGTIYLIPNTLGDSKINDVIPQYVQDIINSIDDYVVENIRTTRRYLRKLNIKKSIDELNFYVFDKKSNKNDAYKYIKLLKQGQNIGIVSEAGCPGIADPGADFISVAHESNIDIVPLVGPSSILLALISSGFNGQEFTFSGYLPIERGARVERIKELERRVFNENQTQIFMETPYRNNNLLEDVLKFCNKQSKLCIATDITLPTEFIKTKTINDWKKNIPNLKKRPTIFLLYK